jgi:hypothetical protein
MTSPPDWLDEVVREISSMLHTHEQIPMGCHVFEAADCWEVSLFLMRVEVLGGQRDGQHVTLPFHLDLSGLTQVLDQTESVSWQSSRLGSEDDLGPHVSLTGRTGEHRVWIRILAEAPKVTPTAGMFCARTLELHAF